MANARKTLNDGTTDWTDDSEITPVDSAPIAASTAIKKPNKKLIIILSAIALAIIAVALVIIFISSQDEAEGDMEIISDGDIEIISDDDIEIISDGILYNVEDGKATVESFLLRYAEELTIPETIAYNNKEYPVTSIGVGAFYNCTSLTSIVVPESVTYIGDYAFGRCSSLISIVIPESVTSIGAEAFYGCTSLTSIVIPEGVTYIGSYAFEGCSSLRIYCEAPIQPDNWSSSWNYSRRPVVWGAKQ